MKQAAKKNVLISEPDSRARSILFWLTVSLLVLTPLVFSTTLYRSFALPKFALLLIGSSLIIPLLALNRNNHIRSLWSKHTAIVCLYVVAISISTLFGVAPLASLFGSAENQMGLITRFCFLICFFGLQASIGTSEARLKTTLAAITVTGLLVAAYAFAQFFGRDPFQSPSEYTLNTAAGALVRVTSTLGHADYLGNFLLYTTPLAAGLAIVWREGARSFALIATALSIAAIAISGTRGAWLGLIVGAVVFVVLELRGSAKKFLQTNRRLIIKTAAIALVALPIAIWVVSLSPASNSISLRARSLISEGWSGAGRTLLWRDSLRMVSEFAIAGCGPEGFRKAFLEYKSKELARLAPQTNNESSHNSYIDAAISYGLPGAILYVAVIVSSLSLLIDARRRATSCASKLIITSLVSSLAGVATHNFFIFDQISTGLYFFAFAALAASTSNIVKASIYADSKKQSSTFDLSRWQGRMVFSVGCALVLAAAWYSINLVRADIEINKALASANAGDFDRVVDHGQRTIEAFEPTGTYNFLFASALAQCAERMQSSADNRLVAARMRALEIAAENAERSLKHTLTPDSSYLLLAYLALSSGNTAGARAYASEAIKIDPNYSPAHRLMAEAYLAEGNRDQAVVEARLSVELDPFSPEAVALLKRAKGKAASQQLIARARKLADAGKIKKARRKFLNALRRSTGPCPDCHHGLALVYEKSQMYENAIAEWQAFIRDDPARAASEQAQAQIEMLKQKSSGK